MVMSKARCKRAISAKDFNVRHPLTLGAPFLRLAPGRAFRRPSTVK